MLSGFFSRSKGQKLCFKGALSMASGFGAEFQAPIKAGGGFACLSARQNR
jgi:hypothetical protein